MTRDRGASSVIGVILLVAVTVILAAVIGSFVLGMGEKVDKNPQGALSFNQVQKETKNDGDGTTGQAATVKLTVVAKIRASDFTIHINDAASKDDYSYSGPGHIETPKVGEVYTASGLDKGDSIVVTATDNKETITIGQYTVE